MEWWDKVTLAGVGLLVSWYVVGTWYSSRILMAFARPLDRFEAKLDMLLEDKDE